MIDVKDQQDKTPVYYLGAGNLQQHQCFNDRAAILVSCGNLPFRIPDHVNIVEARALLVYIRLCVREGRISERILIVIDSGFVKGALRKLRSSSRGLNFVFRQLAGLSLGCDLYIEVLWVPTWGNPGAPPPSRKAPLAGGP